MNHKQEFMTYANKHIGIPTTTISGVIDNIENSMTPYILEERELRATQMDIFSRLMMDRIMWLAGVVDDRMGIVAQAQLMFLDSVTKKDIIIHVDTPGGSIKSGLSIIDVMNYISSDIVTINTGMAASMGSVLLGAGTKGKRFSLPFSKVMIHQSSAGIQGNIQDAMITVEEWKKDNELLFKLLGEYTDKTAEQIKNDATRDKWLRASEAVEYGIIDGIIKSKKELKK